MRRFLIIALLATSLVGAVRAQEGEGGFLERNLESTLSAEGRTVRIEGFEGALSSQARTSRGSG